MNIFSPSHIQLDSSAPASSFFSTLSSSSSPSSSSSRPRRRRRRAGTAPSPTVIALLAGLCASTVNASPLSPQSSSSPPSFLCPGVSVPESTPHINTQEAILHVVPPAAPTPLARPKYRRAINLPAKYYRGEDNRWHLDTTYSLRGQTLSCQYVPITSTSGDGWNPPQRSKLYSIRLIIVLSLILACVIASFITAWVLLRRKRTKLRVLERQAKELPGDQEEGGQDEDPALARRIKSRQKSWANATARWKENAKWTMRRRRGRKGALSSLSNAERNERASLRSPSIQSLQSTANLTDASPPAPPTPPPDQNASVEQPLPQTDALVHERSCDQLQPNGPCPDPGPDSRNQGDTSPPPEPPTLDPQKIIQPPPNQSLSPPAYRVRSGQRPPQSRRIVCDAAESSSSANESAQSSSSAWPAVGKSSEGDAGSDPAYSIPESGPMYYDVQEPEADVDPISRAPSEQEHVVRRGHVATDDKSVLARMAESASMPGPADDLNALLPAVPEWIDEEVDLPDDSVASTSNAIPHADDFEEDTDDIAEQSSGSLTEAPSITHRLSTLPTYTP
ncbi:hypothetical protein SISSUDRAFT_20254 [Sistotremastrum suecicum HHB10207 ss-3]|uniref:Uncharacterized protein n=1 Tax=Sistotremastrum suecicum HHB10207 ss-3 TaxID=1314776 RepID=A0A166J7P3_9AGAM|nr:hypothetical protein SISSUDRAFT_20254 [Sistotremastrum suecicum HHB10207 ss-3]